MTRGPGPSGGHGDSSQGIQGQGARVLLGFRAEEAKIMALGPLVASDGNPLEHSFSKGKKGKLIGWRN